MIKNLLLTILFTLVLLSGLLGGVAYERYGRREECLKLAFDNSGVETLSEEEINGLVKALNEDPETESAAAEANNADSTKAVAKPNEKINTQDRAFVGSKNSNKFYPADCRFVKLIKEENKIFFGSVEEGKRAGRTFTECNL